MNIQVKDSMVRAYLAVQKEGKYDMQSREARAQANAICDDFISFTSWIGIMTNLTNLKDKLYERFQDCYNNS